MRHIALNRQLQRGITLTETLLVLAVAAALAVAAYAAYSVARNDGTLSDLSSGTVTMVEKIRQVWSLSGDYSSVTAVNLSKAGVLPKPFKFDGDNIQDPFGNNLVINGATTSFAFSFRNLSSENCSKLAPTLASFGYQITVGGDAQASQGRASGASLYKSSAGEINTGALINACGADSASQRNIAVEIR